MTTTKAPTLEELRDRLAEQQAEAEAARASLGAATLDTTDPRKASKRIVDAEATVAATEAAIAEAERREQARLERERPVETAQENVRIYDWIAEYMSRAAAVVEAGEQLKAAESQLDAHKPTSNALYRFVRGLDRKLDDEVAFDAELAHRVPSGKSWPATSAEYLDKRRTTVESLQHNRDRAPASTTAAARLMYSAIQS
jgi:hypothetical protein